MLTEEGGRVTIIFEFLIFRRLPPRRQHLKRLPHRLSRLEG
jgi:hypothetical protein